MGRAGRYLTEKATKSASRAATFGKRDLAFVAPAVAPVIPVLEPEVAAAVAAAEVGSGGLATPLIAGAAIGIGIGLLIFSKGSRADPQGWYNPAWKYCPCPSPVGPGQSYGLNTVDICNTTAGCGATLGFTAKPNPAAAAATPTWEFNFAVWTGVPNVLTTHRVVGSWRNLGLGAGSWLQTSPNRLVPGVYVAPEVLPADSPLELPMLQPVGVPTPKTWDDAVAEPGSQPDNRTETEPEPVVEVPVTVWPIVNVSVPPAGVTVTVPDQIISVDPEPSPDDGGPLPPSDPWEPGGGGNNPPPRGTKERKINVASAGGKVWTILNSVTEGLELIDDLWRALPKDCKTKNYVDGQRRKTTPQQKLADLYACWDHMDLATAVANIFNDQFSDIVYALMGRVGTKGSQALNIPTGLQHALRNHTNLLNDFVGDNTTDGSGIEFPIPKLVYDEKTGAWSIEIGDNISIPLDGVPENDWSRTIAEFLGEET